MERPTESHRRSSGTSSGSRKLRSKYDQHLRPYKLAMPSIITTKITKVRKQRFYSGRVTPYQTRSRSPLSRNKAD